MALQLDEYDLWLLEAAADEPMGVEELSEAGRVPKSTAYRRVPVLTEHGLLSATKRDSGVGRPALIYSLTQHGVDELQAFGDNMKATVARLERLFSRWTGPRDAQSSTPNTMASASQPSE